MSEQFAATLKRMGEDIHVGNDGKFYVPFTESNYESLAQAVAAIEAKQQRLEKLGRRKLSLAVIDDEGIKRTITGCNARTGKKLVTPKPEKYSVDFYPDHPAVESLLAQAKDLRKQLNAIFTKLRSCELKDDPYGELRGDLNGRYDEVENDYKTKLSKAAVLGESVCA